MKKDSSKYIGFFITLSALLSPVFVFADFNLANSTFKGVICEVLSILNLLTPILIAAALLFFFWGLTKFIINSSGNEKEIKAGRNYMLWGILALFVLFTFRAIIGFLTGQFDFGNAQVIPFLPDGGSGNVENVCTDVSSTINFSTSQDINL